MKKKQKFAGDKKKGESLFYSFENKIAEKYASRVPKSIETYHLTLATILWSALIILFSYFAKENINWLWLVSSMILFQYITDLFDGAIGKHKKTNLVRWGFYMDHFLDYVFLASIMIGYSFIFPQYIYLHFFIFAIFVAFMVNSFLAFAATNEFKISYLKIGPTEVRLIFVLANTAIILLGKTYLAGLTQYILLFSFLGLIIVVYQTQKHLWKLDMKEKKNKRRG
ncbi:MAG: hypothetical protein GXO98_01340 [Nitrospirae bacterium]|nr:hypothetical protein [Nitrospirota bacterium]